MPWFIVVILSLFLLGDALWASWAAYRLTRPGVRGTRAMWLGLSVVAVFLAVVVGSLLASIYLRLSDADMRVPKLLQMSVFLWHLLVLPLTLVVLSLTGAAAVLTRLRRRRETPTSFEDDARDRADAAAGRELSRRRVLAMATAAVPPAAVVLATGVSLPRLDNFRVRELTVPVPGLPGDLDGLTIAHLSDTHLGEFTPGRIYRKLLEATQALRADLIVHTGDIINVDADDIPEALDGLSKLEARLGVFVCEGNHDLIQAPRRFWEEARRRPGFRFLRNESATVVFRGCPVQVLGLRWGGVPTPGPVPSDADDAMRRRRDRSDAAIAASCQQLSTLVEDDAFPVLLAHHPHAFDFAPFAKLTLSGHTHGGQLNVSKQLSPGRLMYRYWSGLYADGGGRKLVVSNGAGNWFPLRINAPAEIVKLTLRRG